MVFNYHVALEFSRHAPGMYHCIAVHGIVRFRAQGLEYRAYPDAAAAAALGFVLRYFFCTS